MPCESCHVQFTVFRRKRSCVDCKRFYCSSCLSTSKRRMNNVQISSVVLLCQRCLIFAKRPLLRADLLQLKPKDLIFYLQSKHISTTGCVEKDELVGLVLTHVQQADDAATANSNSRSHSDGNTNSFDNIKQTCQNIFTSITENISDSFTSFDSKTAPKSETSRQQSARVSTDNGTTTHIFNQPRVSTREIPTYASFQNGNHNRSTQSSSAGTAVSTTAPATSPTRVARTTPNDVHGSSSSSVTKGSSQAVSPVRSLSSSDASNAEVTNVHRDGTQAAISSQRNVLNGHTEAGDMHSDCECSDEELMATFSERMLLQQQHELNVPQKEPLRSPAVEFDEHIGNKSRASTDTDVATAAYKTDMNGCEISSQSSFEELGAIGGISDESKATTDTNSSNLEQWQILDGVVLQSDCTATASNADPDISTGLATAGVENAADGQNNLQLTTISCTQTQDMVPEPLVQQPVAPQRVKKVMRRRSDSYLNRQRQRPNSEDDSPTGVREGCNDFLTLHEQDSENVTDTAVDAETAQQRNGGNSCHRCGKNKANLRRQVEKMRRHLESSQMSEADIKRELQNFLVYLEQRSKSIECSDAETGASSLSGRNCAQTSVPATPVHNYAHRYSQQQPWEYELDNNDGIHVYAAAISDDNETRSSRFINLEDFNTMEDLENLTVKQLKEVLMLNRVDYKGCCEKQELLDRVQRLWKNLKSSPAVEKLQTDELCKICMDAPIECVILECGHMATCTNCGKVLSECPICRQYIVRVVRFFRA